MLSPEFKEKVLNAVAIVSLTKDKAFCASCSWHKVTLKQCVPDVENINCQNCIAKRREFMKEHNLTTVEAVEQYNQNP